MKILENDILISIAQGSDDAESIARLAKLIWKEHYTGIIGAAQVEYMLSRFQNADKIYDDIKNGGYTYYIAELGGEPVGYCSTIQDGCDKGLFLSKLYVLKSFRGLGVARLFLATLERAGITKGYEYIRLTANKNNTGAIEAYKKLGFEMCDSIVTDIGGGFVMDDYVFIRPLNY